MSRALLEVQQWCDSTIHSDPRNPVEFECQMLGLVVPPCNVEAFVTGFNHAENPVTPTCRVECQLVVFPRNIWIEKLWFDFKQGEEFPFVRKRFHHLISCDFGRAGPSAISNPLVVGRAVIVVTVPAIPAHIKLLIDHFTASGTIPSRLGSIAVAMRSRMYPFPFGQEMARLFRIAMAHP